MAKKSKNCFSFAMRPADGSETAVTNYQPTHHKIPVELRARADNVFFVFGSKSLGLFDWEMNTIRRGVWSPAHSHAVLLYNKIYTPQNAHAFEVHRQQQHHAKLKTHFGV